MHTHTHTFFLLLFFFASVRERERERERERAVTNMIAFLPSTIIAFLPSTYGTFACLMSDSRCSCASSSSIASLCKIIKSQYTATWPSKCTLSTNF